MKKLVVLTGAGISAESGMSTFRDAGGLWDNYPVGQVATPEGYRKNPELVTEFYNNLRRQLLRIQPNGAHQAIADLEKRYEVTVITQNVDNLHERAGSSKVIHLHGELMKVCSSRNPYDSRYIEELTPENCEVKFDDQAGDGSPLRPFIVWFGEPVPKIEEAAREVSQADLFLIIGTSLVVYPAAGLLGYASSGIPVYLIDPAEVGIPSGHSVHFIRKGATEGMKELVKIL